MLVCECGKPNTYGKALKALREATPVDEAAVEEFLVAIIRAHLKGFGKELGVGVTTVQGAYDAWSEALGGLSRPLLVFDTTEHLPQKTAIKRSSVDGTRSVLEAITYLAPSQHGILAVGSKTAETTEVSRDPTNAILYPLHRSRLPALSYDGYIKALNQSWGMARKYDAPTTRILHYLCGGAPRLLSQTA